MDLNKLIKSFGFAGRGIAYSLGQQNMRVHLLALIVVVIAGLYFEISNTEWLVIILISALVIAFEIVNSALETLVDLLHPDHHPLAGKVKDMAAGAVLVAAMAAIVIAGIIFGDRIINTF